MPNKKFGSEIIVGVWSILVAGSMLSSCVSSGKYNSLQNTYEQNSRELEKLKIEITRIKDLEIELAKANEQLHKTENALIEFYLRYEGKSISTNPITQPSYSAMDKENMSRIEAELNWAKKELTTKESKINELLVELNQKNSEVESLKNSERVTKDKILNTDLTDQSETVIKQLQMDIMAERNLVQNLRKDLENQEIKITKLNSQLVTHSSSNMDDKQKMENLQIALSSKDETIQSLNATLQQNTREYSFLVNKLSNADEKNKQLQQELHSLKDSVQKLAAINISGNSEIMELRKKNENVVQSTNSIKSELDLKIIKIAQLQTDLNKSNLDYENIVNDLKSKNDQIELLSRKLSEFPKPDKKTLSTKSMMDSIQLKNAEIRALKNQVSDLQSINTALTETKNNSNTAEIKTLKEKNKLLEDLNTKQHVKIIELENKVNITSSSNSPNKIPPLLLNRITNLPQEYPKVGIFYKIESNQAHVLIPQSYLFEGESVAMKELGSKLISYIVSNLKSIPNLSIEIIGFGSQDDTGQKSLDGSFRRANTISKLIIASGFSSDVLTIGARPAGEFNNAKSFPAGVELIFHIE